MKRLSNTILLGFTVFAVFAWIIWGEGCLMGSVLSPDGVSYLRMAGAAAAGHPFNPNGVAGVDGWFSLWPVGYPWCIAAVMKVTGLDAFLAARLLATLIVAGLLGLCYFRARPAFPLLALGFINLSVTGIFRCSYSEQPYLLVLVALGFVLSSRWGRWKLWHACTGLCVAAFLCRYVGVFLVGWMILAVAIVDRLKHQHGNARRLLPVVVPVGFFVVGYLLLNHVMCGAFTGGHPTGVDDSFGTLLKRLGVALVNEMQFLAFLVAWAAALLFVMGKRAYARQENVVDIPDGMLFLALGLLCNVTVVGLRFVMPFDKIGFRLLCPGTLLVMVGLVLLVRVRLGADWAAALDALPRTHVLALLAVIVLLAANFQSIDVELRRITHSPFEMAHDPYFTVRRRVLEKYDYLEPRSHTQFPDSRPGEDYWVDFLRPEILIDVPDAPNKGF